MDENRIRQIFQEEFSRSQAGSRFGIDSVPIHHHDNIDSVRIKQSDIIPSISVSGSISMTQETDYTLYLNSSFTPSNILIYGTVVNAIPPSFAGLSIRAMVVGSANLGPSFYFQPNQSGSTNSPSVVTGNIQYPFIDPNIGTTVPVQSGTYTSTESPNTFHALTTEGHIISVEYPASTIHARATVTTFDKDKIIIHVSNLDSGWSINANFIIT